MICPRCHLEMLEAVEPTAHGKVELDQCPRCRGIWFDAQELAALLHLRDLDSFASTSTLTAAAGPSPVRCPRGHAAALRLCQRTPPGLPDAPPLRLHQCPGCDGLWLDGDDLQQVLAAVSRRAPHAPDDDAGAPTPGQALWLFMLLTGLPVERFEPSERRPLATLLLCALCALCFAWQVHLPPQAFVDQHGLRPALLLVGQAPLHLLSHLFWHGNLLHLLGNLYFLWVFGDNVEDRLGHARFLLLYLGAGVAAAGLHCLLTPDRAVPVIGASGAISGVMAAYALLFPHARLISLVLFFRVRWSSATYLLLWFAVQLVSAARHAGHIAWWAHVGGFLSGGLLCYALRPRPRPTLMWR